MSMPNSNPRPNYDQSRKVSSLDQPQMDFLTVMGGAA